MIRVLLADDQRLVRAGFAAILGGEPDLEVVGEAADGHETLRSVRQLRPDVVLMDIRMPGLDGIAAAREIADRPDLTGVRVVMLTTFDLDEYVYAALRAGAAGFLLKDTEPDDLVRAIRVVVAGDALIAPSVTRRLVAEFAAHGVPPDPGSAFPSLTEREHEVLALVAAGLSNDEIAQRARITPATAKTHVSRVMTKLHARDRAQLVMLAYEHGAALPGWWRVARLSRSSR